MASKPARALFSLLVAVAFASSFGGSPASADTKFGLNAQLSAGSESEATAIGRALLGGVVLFEDVRLALSAQFSADAFIQGSGGQGIRGTSLGVINLGARYAFVDPAFVGPYIDAGWGYGLLFGDTVLEFEDDPDVCGSQISGSPDCSVPINRQMNAKVGFGWGFKPLDEITVGVRLDVVYWIFSLEDSDPNTEGPIARFVDRPQDTVAIMLGIEVLRFF